MPSFVAEVGAGSSDGHAAIAPITVALCEGHGVLRRQLMVSLESEGDIAVVAEAELPNALGSIVGSIKPNVLTVDMCAPYEDVAAPLRAMRSQDGIRRLVETLPTVPVLALAGPADDPALALLAGAKAALPKTDALRRGRDVVRTLASGGIVVDRRAARSLSAMIENDIDRCGLNQHHVEILHQVSSGRTLLELGRFFRMDITALEARLEEVVVAMKAKHIAAS